MVSSFYSSNEKKQIDYIKDRKIKEENEFDQQERVDEALDKELGLERKATNIGLMSQRVAKKLASLSTPEKLASVNDILINAINNNRLTDLFEKLKNLPDSKLNKKQQLIRDDLKNAENKKIINELIDEAIPNGVDAIKQTVLESLGGKENIDLVIDMFNKTKESSTSVSKSTKKTETSKVDKTKPNVLDIIGFTDKKEMSDIDILDNAVKFNKLSDLFKELKNIPDDFLNDTQKNIKLKLSDSQAKEIINDLISNAFEQGKTKEIKNIVLNQLVNNSKERKEFQNMIEKTDTAKQLKKRSGSNASDASTEVSTFDKIDKRQFNKGAKKKDTNEELNTFSDLLVKYANAPWGEKTPYNQQLRSIIARQRKVNPKIADRMVLMKDAVKIKNN